MTSSYFSRIPKAPPDLAWSVFWLENCASFTLCGVDLLFLRISTISSTLGSSISRSDVATGSSVFPMKLARTTLRFLKCALSTYPYSMFNFTSSSCYLNLLMIVRRAYRAPSFSFCFLYSGPLHFLFLVASRSVSTKVLKFLKNARTSARYSEFFLLSSGLSSYSCINFRLAFVSS